MNSNSADIDQANRQIEGLDRLAQKHKRVFGGLPVCWRVFGTGSPLVLLHGGSGNWLHWVRNIEVLATRFTVWVPDLPGYGESNAEVPVTSGALVDATLGTLDELVGKNTAIDLVGFSFGALVAAHLASRRPHVRRLALLGPVGHGGPRRMRGDMRSWQQASDDEALRELMRHNLATLMLHEPTSIDALALKVHAQACQQTRFRSKEISRGGGLADILNRYPGPLLLLWGEHDVTADPPQLAPLLRAGRTNGQAQIIADAGHWLQFERADAVNRLLLEWLCGTA